MNHWWQFSTELWWLLDHLKILVASLVPAWSYCKNAFTPQRQFRQIFHLDQLSWICNHYTELLHITHCVCYTHKNDNLHPIVLCIMDNTSALNWTLCTSKKSVISRALARFFYGLLIGSRVGINAMWISTIDNKIANKISRIKATNSFSTDSFTYDYSNLQQEHKEWKAWIFYQPSHKLLSLIWDILLTQSCPNLNQILKLKPPDLGKLCTLDGPKIWKLPTPAVLNKQDTSKL